MKTVASQINKAIIAHAAVRSGTGAVGRIKTTSFPTLPKAVLSFCIESSTLFYIENVRHRENTINFNTVISRWSVCLWYPGFVQPQRESRWKPYFSQPPCQSLKLWEVPVWPHTDNALFTRVCYLRYLKKNWLLYSKSSPFTGNFLNSASVFFWFFFYADSFRISETLFNELTLLCYLFC